jgi:heparin/heparan-sulfate lyase
LRETLEFERTFEMQRTVLASALMFLLVYSLAAAEAPSPKATRFDGIKIRQSHPRIWLDDSRVAWLKKKTAGKSLAEVKSACGGAVEGLALAYVITGDRQSGRDAVVQAIAFDKWTNMRTMAVVYDWCYPLLSDGEKKSMRDRMIKWSTDLMNNGRSWRSFHNGMYSAGVPTGLAAIAMYGDDPFAEEAFAFLNGQWEDVLRMFEFVFPDGAYGEGFDYNRHASYEALQYFLALKTATGRDFIASDRHLQNTAYYIIYCTKPDALVIPGKDVDWPITTEWDRAAALMLAYEYRNPYCQYYLETCPGPDFAPAGRNKWKDVLWYDPELKAVETAGLPLSRIFRDDGIVVARSGWAWDSAGKRSPDTWISFHCGRYFGDHAHFDNNMFEIYHKGELAIDAGRYDDDAGIQLDLDKIKTSQKYNYYQRTIAHNTVLVYDGDEKFETGVLNDGGQLDLVTVNGRRNVPEDYDQGTFPSDGGRIGGCDWKTNPGRWDTGAILAYKATDDFTYVCGDATKSYSSAKLASFVRQLVYVQPDVVVVFDRVVATNPEFKKTWLLHTVNEPKASADGAYYEAGYGEGRMLLFPVLPERPVLAKVGGPDDECMVAGVRFHYGPNASSGIKAPLNPGELPGAWRIEESPPTASAEDCFLNVLYVADSESKEVPAVTSEAAPGSVTVKVSMKDGRSARLTFGKTGKPYASVRIERRGAVAFDGAMPETIVLEEGRA